MELISLPRTATFKILRLKLESRVEVDFCRFADRSTGMAQTGGKRMGGSQAEPSIVAEIPWIWSTFATDFCDRKAPTLELLIQKAIDGDVRT
jgi:hypothetical protein